MYKYLLDSIENLDLLAQVPLIVFFLFFTLTSIQVLREKKSFINKMANLPLESDALINKGTEQE